MIFDKASMTKFRLRENKNLVSFLLQLTGRLVLLMLHEMARAKSSTKVWWLAARPKTLPAAVVPVLVGCCLSLKITDSIDFLLAFCTLLGAIAIQVATNFFNDAIDARKGADTAERMGPRRATASGDISPCKMMWAGLFALIFAACCGGVLVHAVGWPIFAIGVVSAYFAYGYTGGPFPLAYLGLGEIFVVGFFGIVAVAGTVFVQLGEWRSEALLAGAQVGLLSAVLISVNNLRDMATDRVAGKKTLAVRLGLGGGRQVILWEIVLVGMLAMQWMSFGSDWLVWIFTGLPSCSIGLWIAWGILTQPPSVYYNKILAVSAAMLVSYAVITTVLVSLF